MKKITCILFSMLLLIVYSVSGTAYAEEGSKILAKIFMKNIAELYESYCVANDCIHAPIVFANSYQAVYAQQYYISNQIGSYVIAVGTDDNGFVREAMLFYADNSLKQLEFDAALSVSLRNKLIEHAFFSAMQNGESNSEKTMLGSELLRDINEKASDDSSMQVDFGRIQTNDYDCCFVDYARSYMPQFQGKTYLFVLPGHIAKANSAETLVEKYAMFISVEKYNDIAFSQSGKSIFALSAGTHNLNAGDYDIFSMSSGNMSIFRNDKPMYIGEISEGKNQYLSHYDILSDDVINISDGAFMFVEIMSEF